jgi:hypothetical protein
MAKKVYLDARDAPVYFTLVGISCHLKDYRLSYLLNYHLPAEFTRLEDLRVIPPAQKDPSEFSFYYFRDDDHFNTFSLLTNRNQESVLIPEMKQTDFLLIIEGEFKKARKDTLLKNLRSVPNVLTSYEIKFTEIKHYENLLSDLELHTMNQFRETKPRYQSTKIKKGGHHV